MKYLTIALSIFIVVTIIGGVLLSVSEIFTFIKPLGIIVLALGCVSTLATGGSWLYCVVDKLTKGRNIDW